METRTLDVANPVLSVFPRATEEEGGALRGRPCRLTRPATRINMIIVMILKNVF
jgi:hypothetical protein